MNALDLTSPGDLLTEVLRNAYGHLATVEQVPPNVVEVPTSSLGSLPAIRVRPTRREPLISRSGKWAWTNIRVYAFHPTAFLDLAVSDLWCDQWDRVDPGYLPEDLDHLVLNARKERATGWVRYSRPDGLYLAAHRWAASLRLTA
ncbi:hypothetical protein ACFWDN_31315 [Micromonospora chalcea]